MDSIRFDGHEIHSIFLYNTFDANPMDAGIVERKTFKVLTDASFTVDERVIGKQRFANYRSLVVNIDGKTYSPKASGKGFDKRLGNSIMDFLKIRDNVEYLNLISRLTNGFEYFDIRNPKIDILKADLGIGEISDPKNNNVLIDPKIVDRSGKNLLPEEVFKRIHEGIELEAIIPNQIPYYPIWRYEGNKRNPRVAHYIHFDILVSILSNVFVELREEFSKLITVELHLSELNNTSLESTVNVREQYLLDIISRLNEEKAGIQRKYDDALLEIRETRLEFNRKLDEANSKLDKSMSDLNETRAELRITLEKLNETNSRADRLTNKLIESDSKVEELNSKLIETTQTATDLGLTLNSFTPMSASTHTIEFILRLFISERHPTIHRRGKSETDKTWVGVFCGEESNFSTSVKDINAKVLITYPVNSRDTLKFINRISLDKIVERYCYKHFLVKTSALRLVFQRIGDILIENECIVGNAEINNELVDRLIESQTIDEIRPDPVVINTTFNFEDLNRYEYYYKKHYRRIQLDEIENRIYFSIGSGRSRIREYINPDSLNSMATRNI